MHFIGRSATTLILVCAAHGTTGVASPAGEASSRPAGVVEQPCPTVPAPAMSKDFQDRIIDPDARRDFGPADAGVIAALHAAEEDRVHNDWAFLCRYRAENAALRRPIVPRVVFIGDSITEFWKVAHPDFFVEGYVDRGVFGQTTGQMLVRFRQDVIALKPTVVHIMGGTNDFAGNAGPTTIEMIKNNIASMVDLALENDVRVVIGSVPPAGAFAWRPTVIEPAQHIVEFNDWLRRYARDKGVLYVDYHEPLADERDAMKQTFSNDGVHPNRDGYSAMEPLARHAINLALAASNDAIAKSAADKTLKGEHSGGKP
jgi:lysophospholipase L1-like esterase